MSIRDLTNAGPTPIVEEGVLVIRNGQSVKQVRLPTTLRLIEPWCFSQSKLVAIDLPVGIITVCKYAFSHCGLLQTIGLPDGLICVEEGAFEYNSIAEINFPHTLRHIMKRAFYETPNLKRIELPVNLRELGEDAFANGGLTSVKFGLKIFRPENFARNTAFSATIGDELHVYTGGPTRETTASLILIDVNVTGIYDGRFKDNRHVKQVSFEGRPQVGRDLFMSSSVETVSDIPRVSSCMFKRCLNLREVSICDTVTDIRQAAFAYTPLEWIKLPSSLIKIGRQAFNYANLKRIDLPMHMEKICSEAFKNCYSLEVVTQEGEVINAVLEHGAFGESGLTSIVSKRPGICVFTNCKSLTKAFLWTAPTRVCEWSGLEEVTFPNAIEAVGKRAFFRCRSLRKVSGIGEVKFFGPRCFESTALQELHLRNALVIQDHAFTDIPSLHRLRISRKVTSIMAGAFAGAGISELILAGDTLGVGARAFADCSRLEKLEVDTGVVVLGIESFCDTGLMDVTLGESINSIGYRAFAGTAIEEDIVLPSGIYRTVERDTYFSLKTIQV